MTAIASVVEKIRQSASALSDLLPRQPTVAEDETIFIRSGFGDGFVDFSDSELLHRQNLGFESVLIRVRATPLGRYRLRGESRSIAGDW